MNVLRDEELVALVRDDPALLAIADAVSATQRQTAIAEERAGRHKRRRARLALALPAAVAALLALVLLAPWQRDTPGTLERALAAVSQGPVIHALVESSLPADHLVEIESGRERPRHWQTEYWYDGERKLLRTRLLVNGTKITEIVEGPERSDSDLGSYPTGGGFAPQLDPALAGFVTEYREALASGKAKYVGETTVAGRRVKRLRITLEHGVVEEVTVDAETHKPLAFAIVEHPQRRAVVRIDPRTGKEVMLPGRGRPVARPQRLPEWRVLMIESLPRDPSLFAAPKLAAPRPTGSSGESRSEEISLAEAARVLGQEPLWPGRSFAGRELQSVELRRFGVQWTDGRETEGTVVTLSYGDVTVSQAVDVSGSYQLGFNDGGEPEPPGFLALAGPRNSSAGGTAELRLDGVYVRLEAGRGVDLLALARTLRPFA